MEKVRDYVTSVMVYVLPIAVIFGMVALAIIAVNHL